MKLLAWIYFLWLLLLFLLFGPYLSYLLVINWSNPHGILSWDLTGELERWLIVITTIASWWGLYRLLSGKGF